MLYISLSFINFQNFSKIDYCAISELYRSIFMFLKDNCMNIKKIFPIFLLLLHVITVEAMDSKSLLLAASLVGVSAGFAARNSSFPLEKSMEKKLKPIAWVISKVVRQDILDNILCKWSQMEYADEHNISKLKEIIEFGADTNTTDTDGRTALHKIVSIEHPPKNACRDFEWYKERDKCCGRIMSIIDLLLSKGAHIDKQDEKRQTPLHMAAKCGQLEVVRVLLENDANINVTNEYGETPIYWAAEWGHLEVVRLLLEKGANVHVKEKWYGKTPLYLAARDNNLEILRELINKDVRLAQEFLCYCIVNNKVTIAKELIQGNMGVDVDISLPFLCDDAGNAPLSVAVIRGHLKIVRLLIDAVKNDAHKDVREYVNMKNKYGGTPLSFAAELGCLDMAELLLKEGADVNAVVSNGRTALYYAAHKGHFEIVKLLLEYNADVNNKANDGLTVLHYAAGNGKLEVVELLLRYGANVQDKDNDNCTALHYAALSGHLEVASKILKTIKENVDNDANNKENADKLLEGCINLENTFKDTPFSLAARKGHIEIVKLLLENFINFDVKNSQEHRKIFNHAVQSNNEDVIKLVMEKSGENLKLECYICCGELKGKREDDSDVMLQLGSCKEKYHPVCICNVCVNKINNKCPSCRGLFK